MYQAVYRTKLQTNRGLFIDLLTSTDIDGAPRGFGDLRRMAIYFQGAGEHL